MGCVVFGPVDIKAKRPQCRIRRSGKKRFGPWKDAEIMNTPQGMFMTFPGEERLGDIVQWRYLDLTVGRA